MLGQVTKIPSMEDFKVLLRRHDLKATRQRLAVHEAMMVLGHASADMVGEQIGSSSHVRITTASVYNILSQLADMKVYSRRMSSNNKMYFDVIPERHIHLYDRDNNRFRDVQDDELMDLVRSHIKKRRYKGFTIEDIDIQIVARPTKKTKI